MVCLIGGCGLFHLLQPESESYDDAFEGLNLTAEEWRSESNALLFQNYRCTIAEAALLTILDNVLVCILYVNSMIIDCGIGMQEESCTVQQIPSLVELNRCCFPKPTKLM